MINNVVLVGRITADPELNKTNSGKNWSRFSLALNRGDEVDYVNCVAWENQAENLVKFIKKGQTIGVEGRIKTGQFTKDDGTTINTFDIVVHSITFLEPKPKTEEATADAAAPSKDNVPF